MITSRCHIRRIIREVVMYHSTNPANVSSVQQVGLQVGRESAHTAAGSWADEYYGTRPIYVSVQKGKYAGQPLAIDTSGLGLVADLPGLIDTGAYQEEEGVYWDEGSEPPEVAGLVDEDGMLYFEDLLSPGHPAAQAAIEATGTAAILDNIPIERIQLAEKKIMRITKRQLRRIIREALADRYLLSEDKWEKEAARLEQEEEAQSGEIRTIGDLKKLIKQAQAKKRGEQTKGNIKGAIKDAVVDEILGKIPFAGTAKSLFDFVKDSYNLPDESRTGTALDHLDVDDDVAKIVDDPIENAFLDAFGKKLDGLSDDKALEDLNMTKNLSDYLEGEYNNRTVAGFGEGKEMKTTKRQLRRIIREALYRPLSEGYMVPRFETQEDMFLFLDELEPDDEVDSDVVDPLTGETHLYAGESPRDAGLIEEPPPEDGYQEDELDHYDWDAYDAEVEAKEEKKRADDERIQDMLTADATAGGEDWAADTLYDAKNNPSMWQNDHDSAEEYVMSFGQDAAGDIADSLLQYSSEPEVVSWYESLPDREDELDIHWGTNRPTKTVMREILADYFYDGVSRAIEKKRAA
jgi:hypothetical protein